MSPGAYAIQQLYRTSGEEFTRRVAIVEGNIKGFLLRDIVSAPAELMMGLEELLSMSSFATIQAQKAACREASLSPEQTLDFETKLDNAVADAVVAIRRNAATFNSRTSPEFQIATARDLDLRWRNTGL